MRALHAQFANRLDRDWATKYAAFGTDYAAADGKDTFWQAVAREFALHPGVTHNVSKDTIRRNFVRGFGANTQVKTLNGFAQYLGYTGWAAFARAHPAPGPTTPMTAAPATPATPAPAPPVMPPAAPAPPVGSHSGGPLPTYAIAVAAVLFTFWCVYKAMSCGVAQQYAPVESSSEARPPDAARATLFATVAAANAFELDSYRNCPAGDTTGLCHHFVPRSTAYNNIADRITRMNAQGGQLSAASGFEIVGRELVERTDSTAHVRTKEKWRLLWHIPGEAEGVVYNALNEQDYFLQRRADGHWRVRTNHYEGKAQGYGRPVPPRAEAPAVSALDGVN